LAVKESEKHTYDGMKICLYSLTLCLDEAFQ